MKNDNLILVTPVKDEEKNLPNLFLSVLNQNKKPSLWIIVNDGSEDSSEIIIKNYTQQYPWIRMITRKKGKRDIGIRYSKVCKKGFNYALIYCKKNKINYNYIGLLDADIIIPKKFFNDIIQYFKKNKKLGIISGSIWSFNGRTYIEEKTRSDLPNGAARVWRKECFLETNGYEITYSPDSVSNIKAKNRGWEIKNVKNIIVKQMRKTDSAEGYWIGYKKNGELAYYLHQHPLIILIKFIKYLFNIKFFFAFAFLYGFFNSLFKKKPRTSDIEIVEYYHNHPFDYIKKML